MTYYPRYPLGDTAQVLQRRALCQLFDPEKQDTHSSKKSTSNKDVPESSPIHDSASPLPSFMVEGPTRASFTSNFDYHSCSQSLVANFHAPLYNEFRRSALDDLLARRVDYGFRALVDFYRTTITRTAPMPEVVLADLINLCQKGAQPRNALFRMISSARRLRQIEQQNFYRIRSSFDRHFGSDWHSSRDHGDGTRRSDR